MQKQISVWVLLIFLLSAVTPTHAENAEPVKKKGKLWLIPVLAGAGFAAGTFVGLSAFDQAINAEEKIWTTGIVFSAAGGLAGWLLGRPKKQHVQSYGLPVHQFELRRMEHTKDTKSDTKTILLVRLPQFP